MLKHAKRFAQKVSEYVDLMLFLDMLFWYNF